MNGSWFVDTDLAPEVKAAFANLEAVFALQGEQVSTHSLGEVISVVLAGKKYYIKRSFCGGRNLRKYLGRSRLCAEWENLQFFSQLGFATPKLVAYGEEKRFAGMISGRGVLITEEIPNTKDLRMIAEENLELFNDKVWRLKVMKQVADFTSSLHKERFIHNDLNWRNMLINLQGEPRVYFFDAPMGRKYLFSFKRFAAKDLAYLDKKGHQKLSKTWRLRFYLLYAKTKTLELKHKQQILRSLEFFKARREQ